MNITYFSGIKKSTITLKYELSFYVVVSGSGKLWKTLLQRREFFSCSLLLAGKKCFYANVERI